MKRMVLRIMVICAFIAVAGCTGAYSTDIPPADDLISGQGTVQYIDLEGGFFGILDDDGSRYYPLNLDPLYSQDQLRAAYNLTPEKDVVTFAMWGTPVRILDMHRIENSTGTEQSDPLILANGTVVYPDDKKESPIIIADDGNRYEPVFPSSLPCLTEGFTLFFTAMPDRNVTAPKRDTIPVTLLSCEVTDKRLTVHDLIQNEDYQNLTSVFGSIRIQLMDLGSGKEQVFFLHSGGSDLMLSMEEPPDAVMVIGQYMEASGYLEKPDDEGTGQYRVFDTDNLTSLAENREKNATVPVT
ncbi:MAG: hypothetical protein JXA44_00955 [Methanospirillaceae archaeon]|nr:hypothetical protein [Methanospirillaceae archaeon]